jgi:hypothetical protein
LGGSSEPVDRRHSVARGERGAPEQFFSLSLQLIPLKELLESLEALELGQQPLELSKQGGLLQRWVPLIFFAREEAPLKEREEELKQRESLNELSL